MSRLNESRRDVEERLADLTRALDREIGWAPKAAGWVTAVIGFSVGVTLAQRFGRKRRAKRVGADEPPVSSSGA